MQKVYTYHEYISLLDKGELPKKAIKRRAGLHLINVSCPDCEAHLWERCENHKEDASGSDLLCLSCKWRPKK